MFNKSKCHQKLIRTFLFHLWSVYFKNYHFYGYIKKELKICHWEFSTLAFVPVFPKKKIPESSDNSHWGKKKKTTKFLVEVAWKMKNIHVLFWEALRSMLFECSKWRVDCFRNQWPYSSDMQTDLISKLEQLVTSRRTSEWFLHTKAWTLLLSCCNCNILTYYF